MNWMDHESQILNRLNKLELKAELTNYILNRIKSLIEINTKDEYIYTETFSRIDELKLILEEIKEIENKLQGN
jgi:hypothetical protein